MVRFGPGYKIPKRKGVKKRGTGKTYTTKNGVRSVDMKAISKHRKSIKTGGPRHMKKK